MIVFFDFDGVLVDPFPSHFQLYKDICQKFGVETPFSRKKYRDVRRAGIREKEVLKQSGLGEDVIEAYKKEHDKRIESKKYLSYDKKLPGVISTLSKLSLNHELIVVTYRMHRRNLLNEMRELGIRKYFSKVLVATSWAVEASEMKFRLLFPYKGKKVVIIGDTNIEITAGRRLGFTTIAISTGVMNKDVLKTHNPDYLVSDLREVESIIKKEEKKADTYA